MSQKKKYGIYTHIIALNWDKYIAWTKIVNLKMINFVLYHITFKY